MQDHFLGRQFHCSLCKVQVPYNRNSIAQHENTRRHQNNRQRQMNTNRNQNIKQRIEEQQKNPFFRTQDRHSIRQNPDLLTKQQAISLEVQREQERIKHKIQNRVLELKGLPMQEHVEKPVWEMVHDTQNNTLYFVNTISGKRMDKKPFGLKLNDKDNKAWELYEAGVPIQREQDVNDHNEQVTQQVTHIGKWEVVPEEEQFENKYRAQDSPEEDQQILDMEHQLEQTHRPEDALHSLLEYDSLLDVDTRGHHHKTERLKALNAKGIHLAITTPKQQFHGKRTSLNDTPPKAATGFKKRILNSKTTLNLDHL